MICFEVTLNGRKLCIAGVGESGVLTTIVNWVGGSPQSPVRGGQTRVGVSRLHVGGLYDSEPNLNVHPLWVDRRLRRGDEVTIRVIDYETADTPKERTVQSHDDIREQQRQYYFELKRQFESSDSQESIPSPKKRKQLKRKGKAG